MVEQEGVCVCDRVPEARVNLHGGAADGVEAVGAGEADDKGVGGHPLDQVGEEPALHPGVPSAPGRPVAGLQAGMDTLECLGGRQ